mgnify:CR=1 FL=1
MSRNIRKILEERGLKQKFVAEKAGYTQPTFNSICNGRRKVTEDDVTRICGALNLEPNDLFAR